MLLLIVNASSIIVLLCLAGVLLAATRFKSGSGIIAAIIVFPTIPVYLYNVTRMLGWLPFAGAVFPLAYSVNLLLMPMLWLFTRWAFGYGFNWTDSLHLLPAVAFLFMLIVTIRLMLIIESKHP